MKGSLRVLVAGGLLAGTAALVGLAGTGAAGERAAKNTGPVAYQVVVTFKSHGAARTQVEWVSPTTGEWRVRNGDRVKIYAGGRYAVVDPDSGTYVRKGSPEFIGYLAEGALSAAPLARYLSGARAPASAGSSGVDVGRSSSGATVLEFRRDGVALRAVVVDSIPLATARKRGLFSVSERSARRVAQERPPGARPNLPVRAYWFGPRFGEHRAVTTVEYSRDATAEQATRGHNSDRLKTRVYITMYELPSAGSESSALPGRLPPAGEIQVVSQPVSLASSQANIQALNGVNGGERYDPWPREQVRLANGEHATVVPNLSEGTHVGPSGEKSVWQFAVITGETLTWVSGGFNLTDMAAIAAALRPVEA